VRVLVVGCGYVGQPLAERLAEAGHDVFGLSRKPPEFGGGIVPIACDITRRDELKGIPRAYDAVINTASSSKGGAEEYRSVYFEGTRNLLAHLQFQKYIWTSSTSVYAQSDGGIVTEESPAEPLAATSRILRETEEVLLKEGQGIVLRLSGIYGPDRGHLFQQYLRDEARIHGGGARWLNMIHREDAVGAIIAALETGHAGDVYNVTDNEPVTERDFFTWLAKQLKRELPPAVSEGDFAGRKRGVTNKRVSNDKMREQLGCTLVYPTFREGYGREIVRLRLG
jgi:nucleoside-diphosphate-sugar epimerase